MARSTNTDGRTATAPTGPTSHAGGAGPFFALASAMSFGLSGTLGSGLEDAGWSPAATVAVRALVSALALMIPGLWLVRGRPGVLVRSWRAFLTYGGVAVAATQLCYMEAVATIPVGVGLLIEYLAPVLLVGWAWARHGHRPSRATTLGTVVAIAGLVLVLDLTGAASLDLRGIAWALAAAVGLSIYFLASADTSSPLPPLTLAAGSMLVAAVLLGLVGAVGILPLAATTTPVMLLGSEVPAVVALLALGLLCGATAYSTGILAARRLGPTVSSFIGLTEVLFAVAIAWALLGQALGPIQLAGGVAVVVGVALVRLGERPLAAEPTPDPLPGDLGHPVDDES